MKINEVHTVKEYRLLWEKFGVSVFQSWEWASVKSPTWQPVRLRYGDIPLAILLRKIPLINQRFGYIPRAFSNNIVEKHSDELRQFLEKLRVYARDKLHLTHLLIDPNICCQKNGDEETAEGGDIFLQGEKIFQEAGFKAGGVTVQPNQSNIINLEKGEDKLFMELSSSTRNRIHKVKKTGQYIAQKYEYGDEGSEYALSVLYRQLEGVSHRAKFGIHAREYFQKIWNMLGPEKSVAIFVVTLQTGQTRKAVGASLRVYDRDNAYALYSGVSSEGLKQKAGYLLQWESIKDACSIGKKQFDQWGVAPMKNGEFVKSHSLYGVSLYKKGFGGDYFKFMSQQQLVFNRTLFWAYKYGKKIYR